LDSLRESQPRTTLVVAHRLGTIKRCDKIAVLGHGGVEELGSHAGLLAKKGLYFDLWQKQGASESDEEQPWKGSLSGGDKDKVNLVVKE
jgi:ABC-type multidrug transport system fused ATPase/permease subunit